jgi:hypothetical protein
MKCRGKFALFAVALAVAVLGLTTRAAQDKGGSGKGDKKTGVSAEVLQKYDRNGNGRLDPDEEAAMRAEEARIKRQKDKKKSE